jgi:carboxyl-terminal processing protease
VTRATSARPARPGPPAPSTARFGYAPRMTRRSVFSRVALVGALAVAFLAGLGVEHVATAARRGAAQPYRPLDVFAEVLEKVENEYVDDVEEQELVYGAIDGIVGRLDPHSAFMRPDVYRQLREDTTGEFDGLGIELAIREGVLTVVAPLADSPGERAGIRPGDRILAIDGTPTKEMPPGEAIRRMKGPVGTRATLEVMRDGFTAPQSLTLVRDRVRTQSVELHVADAERRYAHVRVKAFQERTERSVRKALDEARARVGGELRGLVLDLRSNPGGLLDQAVRVADLFLSSGVIVTTEGRDRRDVQVERAREKETEPSYPVIVLVNKGTASASEIVAGALQDHGRAVVMGTTTFGKGSVQTIVELEDGSGLKLTVARYYTPKHRSIQEKGIAPDVVVEDGATVAAGGSAAPDAARPHGVHGTPLSVAAPAGAQGDAPRGEDRTLRAALDHLRALDDRPARRASPQRSAGQPGGSKGPAAGELPVR